MQRPGDDDGPHGLGGPWARTERLESVDSTNAHSLRNPVAWRLVTAGEQVGGRGRRGRTWVSPPGTSASMSVTVPLLEHRDPGWMPLLTGLAVARALGRLVPRASFALKWPNDVLATGPSLGGPDEDAPPRKVCGVLCQIAPGGLVVVGIGINVAVPQEALPVATATSLQLVDATAPTPHVEQVVAAVADAFVAEYRRWERSGAAFDALRADYRAACSTLGCVVDIHVPGGSPVRGRAVDVDDSGGLLVVPEREPGAVPRRFAAGDVEHVRPAPRPT